MIKSKEKPPDIWPSADPRDRAWHLFKLIIDKTKKDYGLSLISSMTFYDYDDSVRFRFEEGSGLIKGATITWYYSLSSLGLLIVGPENIINMDVMPKMAILAEEEMMIQQQMANMAVYIIEMENDEHNEEPTC